MVALLDALTADPVALLGWAGNALYFGRFLIQWLASERAKVTVAPTSFWWLSLGGALLLGVYSLARGNQPFVFGYALTFVLYVRNLSIALMGERAGTLGLMPSLAIGAVFSFLIVGFAMPEVDDSLPTHWVVLAFVGQAIFSSRFVVQWFASERQGRAHFPPVFWWLSLVGNGLILAYAIRLGDPVFIAGFAIGPLVQIRNLMLGEEDVPLSEVSDSPSAGAGTATRAASARR